MATPIIMPKFGQMTEESAIVEWLKKEGDKVAKGDILFTVETDKSVMEVESFEEGTLLKIVVPPRVNVPVQSTVGFLGTARRSRSRPSPPPRLPRPKPRAAVARAPASPAPLRATPVSPPPLRAPQPARRQAPSAPPLFRISPRAAALARRLRHRPVAHQRLRPAGPRCRKGRASITSRRRATSSFASSPAAKRTCGARKNSTCWPSRARATRAASRVADVQRAIAEKPKPMSKMRQIIAQRLTQSFRDTPAFLRHRRGGHD